MKSQFIRQTWGSTMALDTLALYLFQFELNSRDSLETALLTKIRIVSLGVSRDERAVQAVATFAALRHNPSGKLGARQLWVKNEMTPLCVFFSFAQCTSGVWTGAASGATNDFPFGPRNTLPTLFGKRIKAAHTCGTNTYVALKAKDFHWIHAKMLSWNTFSNLQLSFERK
jgi:hypothetical protein